jgi:hypothetical protein
MYWIMLSERSHEYQYSHDDTPPQIEQNNWAFDNGQWVSASIPVIHVPITPHPDEVLTDNIPAYGCAGLLINARVKAVFDALGIQSIQYFQAAVTTNNQPLPEQYWIANIVGSLRCIDWAQSDLLLDEQGEIEFINSLSLRFNPDHDYGAIFRLAEFLPAIAVSDPLKQALEAAKITGFMFYKPEEFSL